MTKKELKRQCCVCKKITFHADTYGTWLRYKHTKKEYKNKWAEYNCISRTYQ